MASDLADNIRFLKALIARPKNIGALFPSSPALAAAIAQQIDPNREGPVLELGPGTGVVTQAILDRGVRTGRLVLVEYDVDMAAHLTDRFDGVHVIQGDAFNLTKTLNGHGDSLFSAIVSGLPLLNFPVAHRRAFIDGLLQRLVPGAPLIQFSYGTRPPVPAPPGWRVVRAAMIWANIPPARVWVYRKI